MINDLFKKKYNPQSYHCVHFVIDCSKEIYSLDYSSCFVGLTGSLDESIKTSRKTVIKNTRIKKPIEACIILMTYHDDSSHVGICHKGRVFHLTESGVQRITLEQARQIFKRIRFYEPNLHNK